MADDRWLYISVRASTRRKMFWSVCARAYSCVVRVLCTVCLCLCRLENQALGIVSYTGFFPWQFHFHFFFFKVKTVNFQAGDKVAEGDIMVEIEHHPDHWDCTALPCGQRFFRIARASDFYLHQLTLISLAFKGVLLARARECILHVQMTSIWHVHVGLFPRVISFCYARGNDLCTCEQKPLTRWVDFCVHVSMPSVCTCVKQKGWDYKWSRL